MTRALITRRLRWAVPAGVAAAVAIGSLTTSVVTSAAAEPNLPPRTAAQLLVALEQAHPSGLSGTIVETAKLGLPQLPDVGPSGGDASLSLSNLVTGAHTLRVWYGGQQDQRIALLGQLSETDVIHHGVDLWSYSSSTRQVTHTTVPVNEDATRSDDHLSDLTPQAAADKALKAIDPTTTVDVDRTASVAGRAAYQLVLQPKDTRSLVGSVRIAIDAQTSVPLRVQVFARGALSPAIQVGFTDVSFKVPDASVFEFVPPAGSTVVQGSPFSQGDSMPAKIPAHIKGGGMPAPSTSGKTSADAGGSLTVLGDGWTAVVEIKGGLGDGAAAGPGPNGPSANGILNEIATPVKGGRLITSALVSVFIADDGTIFAGPVSGDTIQQIAATGHGL